MKETSNNEFALQESIQCFKQNDTKEWYIAGSTS